MNPAYMMHSSDRIETGVIVDSLVLETDPTTRKSIDIVTRLANMNSQYVKKADPVLRRLAKKYRPVWSPKQVTILAGISLSKEASLSVNGW